MSSPRARSSKLSPQQATCKYSHEDIDVFADFSVKTCIKLAILSVFLMKSTSWRTFCEQSSGEKLKMVASAGNL